MIIKNYQKWQNLSPKLIFKHFLYFFCNFQYFRGLNFQEKWSKMTKLRPNIIFCSFFIFFRQLSKNPRTPQNSKIKKKQKFKIQKIKNRSEGINSTPTGDNPHAACPSKPRWGIPGGVDPRGENPKFFLEEVVPIQETLS